MITIRQSVLADGAELARIDLVTWTAEVSPAPPPSDPSTYAFFSEHTLPGNTLVASLDGVLAGYLKLQPASLPARAHVIEICGLAVDPASQGRGVGYRLIEAAVEQAVRHGAHKVSLRVLGPNLRARRLYEGCGFVVEGVLREEFWLDGRYVDDVVMARALP